MTAVIVLFFVKLIDLVVESVCFVLVSSNCRYKVVPSRKRHGVPSAGYMKRNVKVTTECCMTQPATIKNFGQGYYSYIIGVSDNNYM